MARLGDCYKNIIDPRKGFDQGIKTIKKSKFTAIEKKMATVYIDENIKDDEESSDEEEKAVD